MSENTARRQWREKHKTRNSSLREGLGPLRLDSARSRGLALAAIALTSAVLGATVTGQVFAYKISKMETASLVALPAQPEKPAIEMSTVVVATQPLRFGDKLDSSNLREMKWIAGSEPQGSFRTIAEITAEGEARNVLGAIEPDEPILAAKITGPGERATLAAVVTDEMRAITVSVDEILGVAGFVLPGDRVDVVLTRNSKAGDPMSARTDILLQNIKVLAIDQSADDRQDKPAVSRAVTVEVDPAMAQKLVLGQSVGRLSLLLRPAGSAHQAKGAPVMVGDLAGATRNAEPVINIIRGTSAVAARSTVSDGVETDLAPPSGTAIPNAAAAADAAAAAAQSARAAGAPRE